MNPARFDISPRISAPTAEVGTVLGSYARLEWFELPR